MPKDFKVQRLSDEFGYSPSVEPFGLLPSLDTASQARGPDSPLGSRAKALFDPLPLPCGNGLEMRSCAHERRAYPNLLAHICGWDAKLADLEKRLRCSKCGKKSCQIRVVEIQKPRGTRPAH